MKRRYAVILTASLLLFAPWRVIGKGRTTKIVIEGANLRSPIELTDPKVLANFQVWTGPGAGTAERPSLIIDWPQGPLTEVPQALQKYQISFYSGEPAKERRIYVVYYAFSPGAEQGYVYLPGGSDEWYQLNMRAIWHGEEGKWFLAWSTWERLARPLIQKAVLANSTP